MLNDVLEFCPPVEGVQRLDFLFAASVSVTSRLSGADHLRIISLSPVLRCPDVPVVVLHAAVAILNILGLWESFTYGAPHGWIVLLLPKSDFETSYGSDSVVLELSVTDICFCLCEEFTHFSMLLLSLSSWLHSEVSRG